MTADRFEHVISHAHLGKLGDDRVPNRVGAPFIAFWLSKSPI
jgi:hypothetical protein